MDKNIESVYGVEKSTEMENINNVFLCNIGRQADIHDEDRRSHFYKRMKSILEHSLVSDNYYEQFIKNEENNCYSQNYGPRTHGYSKDYVSLIDPVEYHEVPSWETVNLSQFVQNPGVYVVLKRGLIENLLTESKADLTIPTKIKAINSSFLYPNYRIGDPLEYVIRGEVKVRDKIPLEEICAIALGEVIIRKFEGVDFISQILNETNMGHLPILKLENTPDSKLSLTISS